MGNRSGLRLWWPVVLVGSPGLGVRQSVAARLDAQAQAHCTRTMHDGGKRVWIERGGLHFSRPSRALSVSWYASICPCAGGCVCACLRVFACVSKRIENLEEGGRRTQRERRTGKATNGMEPTRAWVISQSIQYIHTSTQYQYWHWVCWLAAFGSNDGASKKKVAK
jgi:hypothetical protein